MELIIIVFLYLISVLILKPKFNTLNCGIFGWAGKDPKKFNKDKFDKLGIYNIERGKESCGVSVDGDIFVGASSSDKNYLNFLIKNNNITAKKYPVVIGHTRQASVGNIVNESNAHPFAFGVNNNGDGYEFIGCHNGTLYNHKELASKYDIPTTESKAEQSPAGNWITSYRTKIDSEILLEIIYTQKNFKVLSEYTGAAALMFTNTNEPNRVYVWKGASRLYNYASNKPSEERPLCYYIENKNSLYISSLADSLVAIGGIIDKNVFSFEDNTLYIITDGDIKNAETLLISRESVSQKELYTSTPVNYNYGRHGYMGYGNHHGVSTVIEKTVNEHLSSTIIKPNIYSEGMIIPQNEYGKKVYFNRLRYWQKGHLITGIYTFIVGYGFYKLTDEDSLLKAYTEMEKLIGIPFIDGNFDFSFDFETAINYGYLIPFKNKQVNNIHFFVEGVKIRTYFDYQLMFKVHSNLEKGKYLDHVNLSHISCNPVIDMSVNTKPVEHQGILYNGKLVSSEIITPLGAEKIYHIDFGNLQKLFINNYCKRTMSSEEKTASYLTIKEKYKAKREARRLELLEQQDSNQEPIILPFNQDNSLINNFIKEQKELEEFDNLEALSGEYELISENLNEALSGLESHIENLKKFNNNPDVSKKITELKNIRDNISIVLETKD